MDFGRSAKDGRRILGKGKTWRGFFGGALAGIIIGSIQLALAFNFDSVEFWGFGPMPHSIIAISLMGFGAMFGDALGSYIKRRSGKAPGAPFPGLDQYDFLIGAWLLLIVFQPIWFFEHFLEGSRILGLFAVLAITPILHRSVNILGYKMGKKDVPW